MYYHFISSWQATSNVYLVPVVPGVSHPFFFSTSPSRGLVRHRGKLHSNAAVKYVHLQAARVIDCVTIDLTIDEVKRRDQVKRKPKFKWGENGRGSNKERKRRAKQSADAIARRQGRSRSRSPVQGRSRTPPPGDVADECAGIMVPVPDPDRTKEWPEGPTSPVKKQRRKELKPSQL
jgi:hypothetical protein